MSGIYVHIPYCIQRCRYCDFTTFEQNKLIPPSQYLDLLCKEIDSRSKGVPFRKIDSVYFGGGTPSLFDPALLKKVLDHLRLNDFELASDAEVTIEVNPATVHKEKLLDFLDIGVNRFSLGVQSFSDKHLKACGREHSVDDTHKTLELLQKYTSNFSLDLLFALPNQSISELLFDLECTLKFNPHHVSSYVLTVPPEHPMSRNRPKESQQIAMFEAIDAHLTKAGYKQYEISNYSKVGYESQHNLCYWNNKSYWGIGLSSHSFFSEVDWGVRFWNPKSLEEYQRQIARSHKGELSLNNFTPQQVEHLRIWEALTDFCHTHLRTMAGLPLHQVESFFGTNALDLLMRRISPLLSSPLLEEEHGFIRLTRAGQITSNKTFLELTFLSSDFTKLTASNRDSY